jgi:endonuclease/exonuclease/phosphatase family metal-dependent hydrolase
MKILSLNIFGGRKWEDLEPFLKHQAADTDLYCFQEVTSSEYHIEMGEIGMAGNPRFSDLYEMITSTLQGFTGYFGCELRNMPGSPNGIPIHYGSGLFIREGLTHEYHEAFAYGAEEDRSAGKKAFELSSRIVQTALVDSKLAVHHLHGVWALKDKSDVPGRTEQAEKINKIMSAYSVPQILCGDLNLGPRNASLKTLTNGRRNLIDEYNVGTTRPHHTVESGTGFCDYAIVTNDVKLADFKVLPDVVSDHLALQIEVSQ